MERIDILNSRPSPTNAFDFTRRQNRLATNFANDTRSGHVFPAIYISGHANVHLGDRNVYGANTGPNSGGSEPPWDQGAYDQLITSLRFDRMYARVQNISPALPRTGDWLLHHPQYLAWHDENQHSDHHGFLWLKGKPGTGKSTLMKLIFEHSRQNQPDFIILSYFFNARAPSDPERSSLGLYRSIILQVLDAMPEVRPIFYQRFFRKVEYNMCFWTASELQEFLVGVIKTPLCARITILVDALDEGNQDDIRHMISFLEDLTHHALESRSNNLFRVCLSSRHYPHISIKRGLSVILEDQAMHIEDIRTYIQRRLFVDDPEILQSLGLKIQEKSGGIFLWVALVVPMLNTMHDSGCTLSDMLSRVETVPAALHGVFGSVLFVDRKNIQDTVRLFQWLLFAVRPLGIKEIYTAVLSEDRISSVNINDLSVDIMRRYLLDRSRGLVEFVTHQYGYTTVQFIHETVRDFLIHENGLVSLDGSLSDRTAGLSHESIMLSCFHTFYRGYAHLIHYALDCMFWHAAAAQSLDVDQTLFLTHFSASSHLTTKWLQLHRLCQFDLKNCIWNEIGIYGLTRSRESYDESLSMLYMLVAMYGADADCLIEALLSAEIDVNIIGGYYSNPLQAACARGREKIAKLLLKKGADLNAAGGYYENALIAALYKTSDSFVQFMSNCQAKASDATLRNTLRDMIQRRDVMRVQRVLDMGIQPDVLIPSSEASTSRTLLPLHIAIDTQDTRMIDVLLRNKADINLKTDGILPPLSYAVESSSKSVILSLLQHGADPNLTHSSGKGSALHAALARSEAIAHILVDYGAHGDVVGHHTGKECTALEFAMRCYHNSIVNRLLENGANFNGFEHGYYGNLLHTKAAWGDYTSVRIMLDRGADINRLSGQYGTPLQAAACFGKLDVVELLLARGADVGIEGGEYGNALTAALIEGHSEISKLLRDKGAIPVDLYDDTGCGSDNEVYTE